MRKFKAYCDGFKDQLGGQVAIIRIDSADEPDRHLDFKQQKVVVVREEDFNQDVKELTDDELRAKLDACASTILKIAELIDKRNAPNDV